MDEAKILSSTYYDRMTVSRFQLVKGESGETKMEPMLIYKDIPCALSMRTKSKPDRTEIAGETQEEYEIFAAPEIRIKDKDLLTIRTGTGEIKELRVGRSFSYPSHIEAVAYRESVV